MTLNIEHNSLTKCSCGLPMEMLSSPIQEIILHMEEVFQCPRDFAICAVYCATSAVLGNRFKVYSEKYYNAPMVWLSVVADSGSNKSTPFQWAFEPINKMDFIDYTNYKAAMNEWKLKGENESSEKPTLKCRLIDDATPEARNKILSENKQGATIYRDEIKGMLDDIGRYNRSGEISQLLSIFDSRPIRIARKSEESLMICDPFLTICGSIQPDLLKDAFGSNALMSNGFNARWLFCYPEKNLPPMYNNVGISKDITQKWDEYLRNLADMRVDDEANVMYLDSDARNEYVSFYNELQLKKGESGSYIGAMFSKLQIYVLRWALLTHFLSDNIGMTRITGDIMKFSVSCMRTFEAWHRKVFVNLSTVNHPRKIMGNEELLQELVSRYKVQNQSKLADAIGISRQALSKALKKDEGLQVDKLTENDL